MPRRQEREPGSFRLQATRLHLTYKTHLSDEQKDALRVLLKHNIKQWSFVHEHGTNNPEETEPYAHTHVYARLEKKLETENQRYFDIDDIHPHIQTVHSKAEENRVLSYHQKAPIKLEQIPPYVSADAKIKMAATMDPLDWINDQLEQGGNMGQIAGMLKYQELAKKRKREEEDDKHEFKEFTRPFVQDFRCMYVWGPSQIGKTEWCKMHFSNYLFVRHMDKLKQFEPGVHDGIIFDDMSFRHLPRETSIFLTDWNNDSDIHCRNSCAVIPKHTKKIFTNNNPFELTFPDDEHKAIRNRFSHIVHITEKTYE